MSRSQITCTLIIIGLLCIIFLPFQVIVQSIVNVLASGRSPVRIYLFLIWLIILFYLPHKEKTEVSRYKNIPVITLGLLFIYETGIQIWFSITHAISWKGYSLLIHGDEITSTGLAHTHFGKSIIGPLFSLISNRFETFDPGIGIAAFTPFAIQSSLLIGIALLFVSILYVYTTHSWVDTKKFWYMGGYAVISFIALKTSIDGGLFAAHGILIIGLLYAITRKDSEKFWKISTGALIVQFLLYLIMYIGNIFVAESTPLILALNSFGVYCIVGYTLNIPVPNTKHMRKISLVGALLVLVLSITNSLGIFSYRNLPANEAIVATYTPELSSDFKKIGSINDLLFYAYSGKKTVGAIIDNEHTLDNLYPLSVPWKTCIPTQPPKKISFTIISNNILVPIADKTLNIYLDLTKETTNTQTYLAQLSVPNCTPRIVSVVAEILNKAGGNHVIVSHIQGIE